MGLEVVSFTIKQVRDENEYIANMGKPGHRADQDGGRHRGRRGRRATRRSGRPRRCAQSAVARATADQERVIAEMASQTRQAEASARPGAQARRVRGDGQARAGAGRQGVRDPGQHHAAAGRRRAGRRRAGPARAADQGPGGRDLAPREGAEATVLKAAEAEQRRIQTLAEAERQRLHAGGGGSRRGDAGARVAARGRRAARSKVRPRPRSSAPRARRRPTRWTSRPAAFQHYNQAAVLDKMLGGHAGAGAGVRRAAVEGGQDHHRLDGRRRRTAWAPTRSPATWRR